MEGGGAYVSPIWYYDVQAQNHNALFLTGHFLVLFSIHVVLIVIKSLFLLEQLERRQYVPVVLFTTNVEENGQNDLEGEDIITKFILAASI